MAKIIASGLRGSDQSGDEGAANLSKPQVQHTKAKKKKTQLQPATLEIPNLFNGLSAEKASDANGEPYKDELSPLKSPSDSESNTEMDDIINKEV